MDKINNELLQWSKQFEAYHLPSWDQLPEIEFYMDQVIEYINGYMRVFEDNGNHITPSMINNYVKLGLIPPPIKKKYSKVHISNLIVITIIKQVSVISLIKDAILVQVKNSGGRGAYNLFCTELEKSIRGMHKIISNQKIYIDEDLSAETIAVKAICNALSNKIIAMKTVELSMRVIGDENDE